MPPLPASTGGLPGRGWLLRLACVVWLCGLLCAPAVRAQSHDAAVLLLNQKTTPNDLWRALQVRTGLPEDSSLPGAADAAVAGPHRTCAFRRRRPEHAEALDTW